MDRLPMSALPEGPISARRGPAIIFSLITLFAAYLLLSSTGHAGGLTLSAVSSLTEILPAGGDSRAALDDFWTNAAGKGGAAVSVTALLDPAEVELFYTSCKQLERSVIECTTRAIERNPRNAVAYFLRGLAKHAQNDFDGAIADFSVVIQLEPQADIAYFNRGRAKADKKDHEGAIADYTMAIRLNPAYSASYLRRGFARQNKQDHDGAMADYNMAIQLNPEEKLAYFNRALIKNSKGDSNGAAADYTKVIQLDPKNQKAYLNRGTIKAVEGDHDGAIADYDAAIGLNPKDNAAFAYRGDAKAVRGDFDGAFADYAKALELNPKTPSVYWVRGYLRYDLRSWTEALADFRKTAELLPGVAGPRLWIWLTRSRLGEQEAATVELRQYMQRPLGRKSGPWFLKVTDFLSDELSLEDLLKASASADPKTEGIQRSASYFLAGNKRLLAGDKAGALDLLKTCVTIGPKSSPYAKRAAAELIAMGIR